MEYTAQNHPKYFCPRTHAPLHLEANFFRTVTGDVVYPIKAGIPQFLRFEPAEDELTSSKLEQLNRLARADGWQSALQAVNGGDIGAIRYVTDVSRASFIELLPLTQDSDVLEIGPSLGQFTVPLARRARSVCALEVVAGQAEFTAERCRQEGVSNVHIAAGGDDCRLPYANESFGLVVLNLVFEWCASRCSDESTSDVQRRLLDEISRVLKPGGALYLATKNRFALRYLIGKPDEHCYGIRFGSALPRWLARILVRWKGHPRPGGFLYSYASLETMVRDAGFEKIDSFWAAPEMRYPMCYVPTDAASIRSARRRNGFIQGEARSTRFLMPLIPAALVKHFTPGLAFLATKHR
jgi:SAM-dependent methyltransferase